MTRTTTRRTLTRLRTALLASTLVLLVTSAVVFYGVRSTSTTVRDRTSQAILEVSAARAALVAADTAAVHSFVTGQAAVVGPGDDYQDQAAVASQSLARVAELNEAGESASRLLQVAEAFLAEYTSSIWQADSHYRWDGDTILGAADLWYASNLLYSDDGVLTQLDKLKEAERDSLDRRLSSGLMNPLASALWIVPWAVLLVLLVVTQVCLKNRFRRTFNAQLLVAMVLLAGLAAGMGFTFYFQARLDNARDALDGVLAKQDLLALADASAGQSELEPLLEARCEEYRCGYTVETRAVAATPGVPDTTGEEIDRGIRTVKELAEDAADTRGLEVLIPITGALIVVLVLWGPQARIDEYRYRS